MATTLSSQRTKPSITTTLSSRGTKRSMTDRAALVIRPIPAPPPCLRPRRCTRWPGLF
jgi:hypothetical protein